MADFEVFNGLEIYGSPATHSRYITAIFAAGGKFHYREDNGEVIVVYGIPEGNEAPAKKEEPKVEAPAVVEEVEEIEEIVPAPEPVIEVEDVPEPIAVEEAPAPAPAPKPARGRKPKAAAVAVESTPEVEEN